MLSGIPKAHVPEDNVLPVVLGICDCLAPSGPSAGTFPLMLGDCERQSDTGPRLHGTLETLDQLPELGFSSKSKAQHKASQQMVHQDS